jgi:GT2 family glycosyltransferase
MELASCEDAGILGCRLEDAGGRAELSWGSQVSLLSEMRQKILGTPLLSGHVEKKSRRPAFPGWVSGACMLIRKTCLDECGFFDERFFMYLEDADLCRRAAKAGWKIYYYPGASAVHAGGAGLEGLAPEIRLAYRRSQLYYYQKHHGMLQGSLLKTYLLLKYAPRFFLYSLACLFASPAEKTNTRKEKDLAARVLREIRR